MTELIHRPRRLRRTAALREMLRETRLDPSNLIYPLFACPGEGVRREVKSMPGVFNLSVDELVKECEDARRGEAARSPKTALRSAPSAPSNAKSKTS